MGIDFFFEKVVERSWARVWISVIFNDVIRDTIAHSLSFRCSKWATLIMPSRVHDRLLHTISHLTRMDVMTLITRACWLRNSPPMIRPRRSKLTLVVAATLLAANMRRKIHPELYTHKRTQTHNKYQT